MKLARKVGVTSQIFQVFIRDSSSTTGAGLTGLVFNTASLVAYYHRDTDTTATAISLVTMTVGTFTSSGLKEIDATNMPGWYQLCPPNAALASGAASVAIHLKGATNMAPLPIEVDLDAQVDVTLWNGTAVSSPATAGIPDVNVKNINNVSASSVTTVSANQGTTQPINFSGTGATAFAQSDVQNWIAAAPNALRDGKVDAINQIQFGIAQAGANGSITLAASASATDDLYKGEFIVLTSSTGVQQTRLITGYTGSTKVAVVSPNWITNPTSSTRYIVFPGCYIQAINGDVIGNVEGNVNGSVGSVTGLTASNLDTTVSSRMATYTQPTGFLAATFPSGTIANTTNITAGTITTATNLTNNNDKTGYALTSAYDFAKGTVAMTESYAALNAALTPVQALYGINQQLGEQGIVSTTMTVKKRDQATTAKTYILNSATTPTAITEAS